MEEENWASGLECMLIRSMMSEEQQTTQKMCVQEQVQLQIDGLMQERRNSIANTLELSLSCTNPSAYMYVCVCVCGCGL